MMIEVSFMNEFKVLAPTKYYAEPSECILRQGNRYLHIDSDGEALFSTDPAVSAITKGMIAVGQDKFEGFFNEMVGLQNKYTEQDLTKLQERTTKPPIVIGGCARTGSTLLLSILGAHKNINAIEKELFCFYPDLRLRKLLKRIDKRRWCEKTPRNILRFREINNLFNSKVRLIHVIRDGRDVVTSVHPNGEGYWVPIERWIHDTKAGLKERGACLTLRYEDLVSEPERTLRQVCQYIDEPFDKKLLSFQTKTNVTKNIAWNEGVHPLNTSRIGKWNNPKHFKRMEEFYENPEAVSLLRELGYD